MPARIVIVQDDPELRYDLVLNLRAQGHDVSAYADPLIAWSALEATRRVEVLITSIQFSPGRSNGLALALMARSKRAGLKILFMAQPDCTKDVAELGECLRLPIRVSEVVETVEGVLGRGERRSTQFSLPETGRMPAE